MSAENTPASAVDEQGRRIVDVPRRPGFGILIAVLACFLYLLCTQIIPSVVIFLAVAFSRPAPTPEAPTDNKSLMADAAMSNTLAGALIFSHLLGIAFSLVCLRFFVGRKWKAVIALPRLPSLTHAVLAMMMFFAMISISASLEPVVMKYVPSLKDLLKLPGLSEWMELMATWPLPVAVFAVAVLPAIGEELWCRGFLGQGLSARYGMLLGILLTSLLFGIIHLEPQQATLAALLGIVIHAVYVWTRSLPVAIALHFANNLFAILQASKHPYAPKLLTPVEEACKSEPWLFGFASFCLLIVVGGVLFQTQCRLFPAKPGLPTWEPTGAASVALPPSGSGTIISHPPLNPIQIVALVVVSVLFGAVLYSTR